MTLIERYNKGETKEVYAEIQSLGQKAFLPEVFPEIEAVLVETFKRVAYNLDIIYTELKAIDYVFFDRPFHSPLPDTEKLLEKLENAVKDFGYVPLSLQYFYKIAGGVNFAWNYEAEETLLWDLADPIQVSSLDETVLEVTDKYWKEDIQDYVDDEDFGFAFLDLSADDLHKDNISGGPPYALKITENPAIDSDFVNEPHETTFIDYLRICFEYCGFPGNPDTESYKNFVKQVKPKLKQI